MPTALRRVAPFGVPARGPQPRTIAVAKAAGTLAPFVRRPALPAAGSRLRDAVSPDRPLPASSRIVLRGLALR
jgi:hypothetical protein